MKQLEMFKATLSRILAFAKANPSYLAPSLCERIGVDMPSHISGDTVTLRPALSALTYFFADF
jgi:hypothetical protein